MGQCRERGCSIAVRYSVLFAVKGGDRIRFSRVHLEKRMQVGQRQNLAHHFRDVAQLHVAVTGSQTSKETNDGTQAAAINESDIAQMQHNLFQIAIETLNTAAKAVHFWSAYDAASAVNHDNITDRTRTECQCQTGLRRRSILAPGGCKLQ